MNDIHLEEIVTAMEEFEQCNYCELEHVRDKVRVTHHGYISSNVLSLEVIQSDEDVFMIQTLHLYF